MSLLQGKRILVTGVLTDDSIAYGVADLAQREGAEIVLTNFGRGLSLTKRVAKHLPVPPDVLELDVTVPGHITCFTIRRSYSTATRAGSSPSSRSSPRIVWPS